MTCEKGKKRESNLVMAFAQEQNVYEIGSPLCPSTAAVTLIVVGTSAFASPGVGMTEIERV